MILGRGVHPAAACFDELEDALVDLGRGDVVLNAHAFPDEIPPGAVVFNLEVVGTQVPANAFQGHELYDFSRRNCEAWRAAGRDVTHVPIGWHPSMKRFEMLPWEERDIDVVFTGCISERRAAVLDELRRRGLSVHVMGPLDAHGAERDAVLARSKVGLNMLYDDSGTFPVLRAAHAAANGLPMINELAPEYPDWAGRIVPYQKLVDECCRAVLQPAGTTEIAAKTLDAFMQTALVIPKRDSFKDPRWDMVRSRPPSEWDLEAMYTAARGGPLHEGAAVAIVAPSYRESESIARIGRMSRNAIRQSLAEAGITSMVTNACGDALVCRMRQRAVHAFLMSPATHMLFVDLDIECLTPDCVQKMLATGHDVIAGACPFKDMTGRTVHNLWEDGKPEVGPDGCVEVRDAGTGFMLISRKAVIKMQQGHPELLHWSMQTGEERGAPLWALFDTAVVAGVYQSEDFFFAHLWQELGGSVYVYAPARFRHWGEHGYEADFLTQYGLTLTDA